MALANTTGRVVGKPNTSSSKAKSANPALSKADLDNLQLILDLAGMIPGVGTAADLVNAGVSAMRGDFLGAALNTFSAIPLAGDAAGLAKIVKNAPKYQKAIKAIEANVLKKLPPDLAKKVKVLLDKVEKELNEAVKKNNRPSPSKPNNNKKPDKKGKDSKVKPKPKLKCGQSGTYRELKKSHANGHDRDHVPSKAALLKRAKDLKGGPLTKKEKSAIERASEAITIPKAAHQKASRTYAGRNKKLIVDDADNLAGAAKADIAALLLELNKYADSKCVKDYRKAAKKILLKRNKDYDNFLINLIKK